MHTVARSLQNCAKKKKKKEKTKPSNIQVVTKCLFKFLCSVLASFLSLVTILIDSAAKVEFFFKHMQKKKKKEKH